ncbi:MAG: BON domain-containing protein [Collimonas pratensis]|uniref:BON domain-containing protein n=1 Tax=Collimonas pratensis TaxID=279113 RepID=UPI003C754699
MLQARHLRALLPVLLAACAMPLPAHGEILKNWFNDPFIQVRNAVPDCPQPLGPLVSEQEAHRESHWRTERGTSCWLASQCSKPNSYLYDAPIAQAVQAHFAADPAFARSSLWLTFQRRFVWVEGCSADSAITAAALEAFVRAAPDVERVIVNLRAPGANKAPYPLAPP